MEMKICEPQVQRERPTCFCGRPLKWKEQRKQHECDIHGVAYTGYIAATPKPAA